MIRKRYLLSFLSLLSIPALSQASITSTTGAVTVVSAPPNAQQGQFENSTQIRAWNEVQNTTLPQNLAVDISVPGVSPGASDANFSPATITAGTVVNSYFLHFDVVGTPAASNAKQADGTITFSDPILGLVVLASNLDATDAYPGSPTTIYATSNQRQLELSAGLVGTGTTDEVILSADRRTLTVEFRDATSVDDLRVITAVPEPGSLAILGSISLGLLVRRKRL